jgi:hypothetical protein
MYIPSDPTIKVAATSRIRVMVSLDDIRNKIIPKYKKNSNGSVHKEPFTVWG